MGVLCLGLCTGCGPEERPPYSVPSFHDVPGTSSQEDGGASEPDGGTRRDGGGASGVGTVYADAGVLDAGTRDAGTRP